MASIAEQFRLLAEWQCPSNELTMLLVSIKELKRSGVLVVNFSQGSPAGTVKFTEPAKE